MRRDLAAVLCALSLFALGTTSATAQMVRSHPKHYGAGTGGALGAPPDTGRPEFRMPDPNSRVVLRRRDNLASAGRPSQKLSRACRDGTFRQVYDRRLIAVLDKRIYGAAIGKTKSLYDPRRISEGGIVYVFVGQGTTKCRVYPMGPPGIE